MDHKFKIPVEEKYLLALGRALYNFTYLEKIIVDIIAKISKNGHNEIPSKAPAGEICKILKRLIPSSPIGIQEELTSLHLSFKSAIATSRNKLLHAHPYTAVDGKQQVGYKDKDWSLEEIYEIARYFELIAIDSNDLYHNKIANLSVRF